MGGGCVPSGPTGDHPQGLAIQSHWHVSGLSGTQRMQAPVPVPVCPPLWGGVRGGGPFSGQHPRSVGGNAVAGPRGRRDGQLRGHRNSWRAAGARWHQLVPVLVPRAGARGGAWGGGGHSMVLSPTSHPHPPTGPVLAVPNHNPPSPFCQCGGGGDVPPLGVPLPHALPLCSPWPPLPHTLPHWPLLPHSPPLCTRRSHCYTPCPCADHGPAAPTLSAPIGPIAPQPAPLQAPAPIAPCIDPLPPNTIAPRSTPRPL